MESLVGTVTGTSEWFTVEQDRINAFADATDDHQWIHIDETAADVGPFGTTIAHGFLTMSLLPHLLEGVSVSPEGTVMGINYGSDKVRFLAPVPSGSRIRAVSTLNSFADRGDNRYLTSQHVVVEIEGSPTPALVADVLTMFVVSGNEPPTKEPKRQESNGGDQR
jgi:acyl dehydratase